jgi:hypothetical protein
MTAARDAIVELLREARAPGTFAAQRTARADDLYVEVKGVGPLRFPVSRTQAQRLCRIARPARYGKGERTLLDRRVRNTWEVPKSRLGIDARRWSRTLLPILDALRGDLGLPASSRLKAELHAMLLYGPGQFFLPHQDSEKTDQMVGTLVVTLPSSFRGGAMVIEHQGEKVTFRTSRQPLSFLAFYADCHHEVRPVTDGYRIVLTYDLVLAGDGSAADLGTGAEPRAAGALAARFREHFENPLPSPRPSDERVPPRKAPNRLVYLLDHQYTERGVGWHRLKGDDAARVALLRAAAERAGCEMALALAEVHETWSCLDEDWDEPWYRRGRWADDEDDEYDAREDPTAEEASEHVLGDLQDWSLELCRWIAPSGGKAEAIAARVCDEEVCSTTPSSALEPYASEYEGYMGNWGNTMDRWYRRGAVVLWPRARAFAVRAEASPAWALEALQQRIQAGEVAEAREMAGSLVPFWREVARREERRGFFDKALRAAAALDAPALATSLLQPFAALALTPGRARAFVSLVELYGEDWARSLLAKWSGDGPRMGREEDDRRAWLASLPRLCEALRAAADAAGTLAARVLLQDCWRWLRQAIEEWRGVVPPSQRDEALWSLARPILGWLEGAAAVEADDLRDETLAFLCAGEDEALIPCLVQVLRASPAPLMPAPSGLAAIGRYCVRRLSARLEQPARATDDWSIVLPRRCRCDLCGRLDAFLADPQQRRLEWPLANERRRHVHAELDMHEIPVRHQTRRSGRPYTLVLDKTEALFEREAAERRRWQADLEWLTARSRRR